MKLQKTVCPHCGAPLVIDAKAQQAKCEYCGMTTLIERAASSTSLVDSEEQGYRFEKGRLRAQAEQASKPIVQQVRYEYVQEKPKKRHTFWWVMGWIFIFPIPATILILRSTKMHWILKTVLIVLVWGLYIAIAASGSSAG